METVGIIYASCIALLGLWLILRTFNGFDKNVITVSFILKILGTFTLQALFTYYYTDRSTADIYRFFDDGLFLNNLFYSSPGDYFQIIFGNHGQSEVFREKYFEHMNAWIKPFDSGFYNDNHIMIKLNSIMAFVSFGFAEVHSILFSLFAYVGILLIIRVLAPSRSWNIALVLAILFPSNLLWLSGGLKETVVITGLGVCLIGGLKLVQERPWSGIFLVGLGILLLIQVKLYILGFLIPVFVSLYFYRQFSLRRWMIIPIWIVCCLVLLFTANVLGHVPLDYLVRKQHEFINHVNVINPGSSFDMLPLKYAYLDLILHIPLAIVNSMLRPFPWEINSAAESLLFFENIYVWALVALAFIGFKLNPKSSSPIIGVLIFIIPILILTGLVTPVFGALMRYRAPALLILIISLAPYVQAVFKKKFS